MKNLTLSLAALVLCATTAAAQNAADPAAGKTLWEGNASQCKNCHGLKGEGGFGPDLAGRGLSAAEFTQAVRKPWGIMPAFLDSQLTDAELANMAAYFVSLPKVAAPGPWRFPLSDTAPHGQQVAIAVGCVQCHGLTLDNVRGTLGATNADFELFKGLVYTHTTTLPQVEAMINPPPPAGAPAGGRGPQRLRMGNFNAMRATEAQLKDIYNWVKDEVGFRPQLRANLAADPAGDPVYTINLLNNGIKDKALPVQALVVDMAIPAGATVKSATGPGYKGVHTDPITNGTVAEWQVPRLAPKEPQALTFTLSAAPANPADLKGTVHWSKPGPKSGGSNDVLNIVNPAGAPPGGGRG